MKQQIPLIAFLIAPFFLFSQSISFPDSFAIWSVQNELLCQDGHGGGGPSLSYSCEILQMEGDTVINQTLYQKIYIYNHNQSKKFFNLAMRSDSTGKVFAFLPDSNKEYILYDFQFKKDTTVYITFPYRDNWGGGDWIDTTYMTVSEIDTVFLFGQYRRRMNFSATFNIPVYPFDRESNFYWIEGVGSSVGLLYLYFQRIVRKNPNTCTGCNWINGFYTTKPDSINCGEETCFIVGLEESYSQGLPSIYPNPTIRTKPIYIEFEEAVNFEVSISNFHGQIIYTSTPSRRRKKKILANMAQGVYFVNVRYEGKSFTQRLVVN